VLGKLLLHRKQLLFFLSRKGGKRHIAVVLPTKDKVNLALLVLDLLDLKSRLRQQHFGKLVAVYDDHDLLVDGFQGHSSFLPLKKRKKPFVVVGLWSVWVTA
jgi:hypothetical protein